MLLQPGSWGRTRGDWWPEGPGSSRAAPAVAGEVPGEVLGLLHVPRPHSPSSTQRLPSACCWLLPEAHICGNI